MWEGWWSCGEGGGTCGEGGGHVGRVVVMWKGWWSCGEGGSHMRRVCTTTGNLGNHIYWQTPVEMMRNLTTAWNQPLQMGWGNDSHRDHTFSRLCFSSLLMPQFGVMSPTIDSARSCTSAILMHLTSVCAVHMCVCKVWMYSICAHQVYVLHVCAQWV